MFPNFDGDLRVHLSEYGNEQTQAILAETSELSADYYDWTVTDLHSGQPNGTRAFAMMNGVGMISGDANGVPAEGSASVRNVPGVDGLFGNSSEIDYVPNVGLPRHTKDLLRAIDVRYKTFGYPNTNVEVEELVGDDSDEEEAPDGSN